MTCDTLGIFARSVDDIELLSKVFQLQDDEPTPAMLFSVRGTKIAFCKTSVWPKAGLGTKTAFSKAHELLTSHGASVEELELPDGFAKIGLWHQQVLAGEGRTSFLGSKSWFPPLFSSGRRYFSIWSAADEIRLPPC
jgi:Asp-tRNA(Asn)/Glu-tRNA(Gln) amidotransferase A subunit family amidase